MWEDAVDGRLGDCGVLEGKICRTLLEVVVKKMVEWSRSKMRTDLEKRAALTESKKVHHEILCGSHALRRAFDGNSPLARVLGHVFAARNDMFGAAHR